MRPAAYFKTALENISSAKLRSLLTSLGIIIGVGSVVMIISLGGGVSSNISGSFSGLGSTRLTVSPSAPGAQAGGGGPGGNGGGFGGGNVASTLTLTDAQALMGVEGVAAAAPVIQLSASIKGPAKELALAATGTTAAYQDATGQKLVAGRIFGADAAEIVLNEAAAGQLFGTASALGQPIAVNGQNFTVTGVFANVESPFSQRRFGGGAAQNQVNPAVYLPVGRALDMAGTQRVAQIVLSATSIDAVAATGDRISAALQARHNGVQDFAVSSFQQLTSSFTQILSTLTLFLAAIAAISLLVGGIGIMNIMLVTVSERTREIGIAKAIGATSATIVTQFLIEAVVLSLIGGVLGLAVAWIGTALIGQAIGLAVAVSLPAIALAVSVSAAIGIFFGVVPAWRAARLDPIVALRHE